MNKLVPILLMLIYGSLLFAGEWHIDADAKNLVKFTSSVSVLSFDGVTDKVDGYMYWEGEQMFGENNQLHIEVDLNSVETGIGKRDRDMQDVLKTDKWPSTIFTGTFSRAEANEGAEGSYNVTVSGKMMIRGVERDIEVPGTITIENGKMHVVSDFSVRLEDYDIEAPSLAAFIKVSQEIKLHLDFFLTEHIEQ